MIISISSTPPVDTTELAKELAEENGLTVIGDPAPSVCRDFGFQTLYDMPDVLQLEIRERLIFDHLELVSTRTGVLLNFSVFQYLADWMRWFWTNTPTEKWDEITSAASDCAKLYDRVYHVEVGPRRAYDGYVWFDRLNAEQISTLMKGLYADFEIADKLFISQTK